MSKGILLANKRKSTKRKGRPKKGTASKYLDNTAQITVQYVSFPKSEGYWTASFTYPRGGFYEPTPADPQESVGDLVTKVSNIIKESMRDTKAEYTELLFKMPAGSSHKLFIYYKDIEREDILNNEEHRDGDMNSYE